MDTWAREKGPSFAATGYNISERDL